MYSFKITQFEFSTVSFNRGNFSIECFKFINSLGVTFSKAIFPQILSIS